MEKHDLSVLRDRLIVSFKGELESVPVIMQFWFDYLDGSPIKLVDFYERTNERKKTVHYENLIITLLISFLAELLAGIVVVEYSRNRDNFGEKLKKIKKESREKVTSAIAQVSDKYGILLKYLIKVYILKKYVEKNYKNSTEAFWRLKNKIKNITIHNKKGETMPEDFNQFEESFLKQHTLPPLDNRFTDKLSDDLLNLSTINKLNRKNKSSANLYKPLVNFKYTSKLKEKAKGKVTNFGFAAGKAKIVLDSSDCNKFENGDVLVVIEVRPDFHPVLLKAGALIADESGPTGHAAILGRELDMPTIVNTVNAREVLKDGMPVLVDALNGVVYEIIE
ncbi:MAG: PEP-utilizing enzyme [archaeon]